ncbi:hypothetical protein [uncultured Methanoregula sp.]|uniref:hypothetical protein n=1 Tax=uncultured Methanoregula sp. TaxID=1005933 RepID=UPI002AAB11E8|nr:hypothetical protein [uncultured Methanoregula sp.]
MARQTLVLLIVLAALVLISAPAAANIVQQTAMFSPNPPLTPGGQQKVVATYYVIPAGSTTFPSSNQLQMETGLLNAQWVIQVVLDGRNAARQTATGNAAFLNGVLLAYPTTQTVEFTVTVTGTVPPDATSSVMLLQVEQLDNINAVVPGSVLTITQPVAGQTPAPTTPASLPTLTPVANPPSQATPRAALPVVWCVLAAGLGLCIMAWRNR